MGATALVAATDLRRRVRDRTAILTALVAPLGFALIMSLAFGSGTASSQLRLGVVDRHGDASTAANVDAALASLSLGPGVAVVHTDDEAGAVRDYAARRLAAVVELDRGRFVRTISAGGRPIGRAAAFSLAAALRLRDATRQLASSATASSPAVHVADAGLARRQNPLGYFMPAMGILFLFFTVGAAANSVLAERDLGTLTRLRAAPCGMGRVVAGKTVAIVLLSLLSMITLWAGSTWLFHAGWGDAAGVAVLILATVAAISAVGLLITVSAQTPAAAQATTAAVGIVLALLGGNFFPPGSLPHILERASLLTPNGWALDGFTTLSLDGGTLGSVLRPVVVLVAMAVVVGAAAVVRFRRKVGAAV